MQCPQCKTSNDDIIVYDRYESGKYVVGYCTRCQIFYESIYGLIGGSINKQEPFPFKSSLRDEYQKLLCKQRRTSKIAKRQVLYRLLKDIVTDAIITDFELHGAIPGLTHITLKINNSKIGHVEIGISLGILGWETLEPDWTLRLISDKHGTVYA